MQLINTYETYFKTNLLLKLLVLILVNISFAIQANEFVSGRDYVELESPPSVEKEVREYFSFYANR
ncbi:hypothetical protein [Shewanella glacialimarina]|jgi:hypothetical protein|uniref:hypothetical protein n=1 Tax=Shewanella glacialimarina TaxID=2590884 RepID=UPI001CF8BAEA|nr:hypothetical protein [Shewanella glacialimarina]UCX04469.1 hypothetical protein FJ709_08130 [Shewanella glacialimarina]